MLLIEVAAADSVTAIAWPLGRALGGGSTGNGPARHDGASFVQNPTDSSQA